MGRCLWRSKKTWLVRSKTHGSGQLSLLGCLRISHPPLGTSLSPKNRNPSNNHWHLCRTSFGRHLPPTTDINKVQLSSPADHKCNSSSDHLAKVLRLSDKMTSDTLWCHKAPHLPHETTLRDVCNLQKCASFSTFKHGTCKAFPAPCTCVPVWTFRSHPYCDARATETSFPCGSSVLAT